MDHNLKLGEKKKSPVSIIVLDQGGLNEMSPIVLGNWTPDALR